MNIPRTLLCERGLTSLSGIQSANFKPLWQSGLILVWFDDKSKIYETPGEYETHNSVVTDIWN